MTERDHPITDKEFLDNLAPGLRVVVEEYAVLHEMSYQDAFAEILLNETEENIIDRRH